MKGKQIRITTSAEVLAELEQLRRTGLFGASVPRVAEQLVRERLRDQVSAFCLNLVGVDIDNHDEIRDRILELGRLDPRVLGEVRR